MKPLEIVILVFAIAFVAAVATVSAARKIKNKKSGCHSCVGCPYAGSCARGKSGGKKIKSKN